MPCENTRNIGIAGCGGEEDAEITDTNIVDIAKKTKTWTLLAAMTVAGEKGTHRASIDSH